MLRAAAISFALTLAFIDFAAAQTPPPNLPQSIEPGRLQQQLQPQTVAPTVTPPVAVEQAPPENAPPAGADKIKLTLDAIAVQGATVYAPGDFTALVAPYLHHEIALVDLFHLADLITTKYRADGYILSRALVPAQHIGTTARIDVIEGFVSEVHFQGYDSPTLDAYGLRVMASKPLRASDLERYLLLANDLSGVQAHAVLSPSSSVAGGAALTVVTDHTLADGSLAVDNRGTKFIGPIQFYTAAGLNIPSWDSRLAVRYITTPSIRELQYGEVSYTQPLGGDGLRAIIYGNETHSQPGYTLEPFRVDGTGDELMLTLAYPLLRSRDHNLELRGSFDVKDSVTVVSGNSTAPPSSNDHLRIFRAGLSHDIADSWGGINLQTLQLSRGVNFLGASANDNRPTPSRPNAQSDFTAWKGEISRQQDLGILYPGLGLLVAAEGQLSDSGYLPASEQLGLGGPQYGRAYDPSDVTADNGWAAKSELQYSPPIPGFAAPYLTSNQLYGFYERGRVVRNISSSGNPALSDAGLGVRFVLANRLTSDLQMARPLTRDETINYGLPHARPWRFFFSVAAQF
jgi:hemolysin activation/secretion protein